MTRVHGFVSAAGLLILAALAAVILVTGCRPVDGSSPYDITYEELDELIRTDDGLVLIDVRGETDYRAAHIPTAVNIEAAVIAEWTRAEAEAGLGATDSGITIVVYCTSGTRASNTKTALLLLGYEDVRTFGMLSRWEGQTVPGAEPGTIEEL